MSKPQEQLTLEPRVRLSAGAMYYVLLSLGLSTGCDKLNLMDDAMRSIPKMQAGMLETNAKLGETKAAIHKQTLLVAINELSKREKYEKLYPVPTELLAPAKGFAEEADAKELVEFTYAMLKDVNEVTPTKELGYECLLDEEVSTDIKDLEKKAEDKTITIEEKRDLRRLKKLPTQLVAKVCPEDFHLKQEELASEMNHSLDKLNEIRLRKLGSLYALMTIAGFTPEAQITEIIREQIRGSGRYETTAHQFLMMRVIFIRDVFLTNSLLATDLHNSGEINSATGYMLSIERILRLSFAEDIGLKMKVVLEGLKDPVVDMDENLSGPNLKVTAALWKTILDRALNGVKVYKKASTGNAAEDIEQSRQEANKQQEAIHDVFAYGKAWFSDLQMP